jgi:glycogen debranching enzyme
MKRTLRKKAAKPGLPPAHEGDDPFYIVAPSPTVTEQSRILKHGETFAIFDSWGDISPAGRGEEGLYHEGTRFLSLCRLFLGQQRPLMLSSFIKDDNAFLAVDLTNPDIALEGRVHVSHGTLHLFRSKFLWEGNCYERIRVRNYGLTPIQSSITIQFDADFADIFEVRGTQRPRRGESLPQVNENGSVFLPYRGLDGQLRQTCFEFSPAPTVVEDGMVRFDMSLQPQSEATFGITISCVARGQPSPPLAYQGALDVAMAAVQQLCGDCCRVHTDNEQFNDWFNRSLADLHMMITQTDHGHYPYAGVPWFSTAFGRDGIITALESLWVKPSLARGVLTYLAATQAKEVNVEQDAEPGKILHETRKGEMAALGEIPFGRYYGSIDSTPLFVLLAGAYYERTGDRELIEQLWPNIDLALKWIDLYGDRDGDGLVEYERQSDRGLVQQGWKDSHDSVFHADGTMAPPPIALCEVQAYVYAAKRYATLLALAMGHEHRASELAVQAERLQEHFEKSFWCEEINSYALALDGQKRPCRVRSSNAGQCLFTGIVSHERARKVADTLTSEAMFSGWGIRTLASAEVRYNPMSYHNGTIWPHDNALIAHGFDRYHLKTAVASVLTGLFDASLFVDLHRLPELFCGFPRRGGEGPTLYPVACSPQAWAAATPFLLLQSALGMRLSALENKVAFYYPLLPAFINEVWIRDLRVTSGSIDLRIERHDQDVGIEVLRRDLDVGVTIVK